MSAFELPCLLLNNTNHSFDSAFSQNGACYQERSVLVAEREGRQVGLIKSQRDAPGVDERYFGAVTARMSKSLRYDTFLAIIGSDIDHSEASLTEQKSLNASVTASSSSTICSMPSSSSRDTVTRNKSSTPVESNDDWEVTLVRFRGDGAAVEGCNAGSSIGNYYEICFFSLLSKPIGSFAFVNWKAFLVESRAFRTELRVFNDLCDSQGSKKAISIHIMGDRQESARMETAPLFLQEAVKEHSKIDGCTWRSLCSALYAAKPVDVKNKLRAYGKRIFNELVEKEEPTGLAEFSERIGSMRRMPLSLSKIKCSVLYSRIKPQLVRTQALRERAMMNWVFEKDRSGIYVMQVVDSKGYNGHVIAINADRRLVYDSYLQYPLLMDASGNDLAAAAADSTLFFCCGGNLTCRGVRNVFRLSEWKANDSFAQRKSDFK